jgi:hypothetical protein
MHEHRESGKKYIGITGQKPETRWSNGLGYMGSPHFWRAIQKYGWDSFRHELLFTGLSRDEAEAKEVELIAKYDTQNPEHGYNIAPGGCAPSPALETRAKIRAANLGKSLSMATRAKLRVLAAGRVMTPEVRAQISRTMQGRVPHNRAAVRCEETGVVYNSMGDAEKQTGIHRSTISRCCNKKGNCKTAGGYHWQFVDKHGKERRTKNG